MTGNTGSFTDYVGYVLASMMFSVFLGWQGGVTMFVIFVFLHRHTWWWNKWEGFWTVLKAALLGVLTYLLLSECARIV